MSIDIDFVDVGPTNVAYAVEDPTVSRTAELLRDRKVWHINTTAQGGGVAELLYATIRHHQASGIDARWVVVSADQPFFEVTKQLHHLFHGSDGQGIALGDEERSLYAKVTGMQAAAVADVIGPEDVVVLHDPQPLGMGRFLAERGSCVVWRTHIGTADWSPTVAKAWEFLQPFLDVPRRYAFSSAGYAPPILDVARVDVMYPSIDLQSVKCAEMNETAVHEVLRAVGLEAEVAGDGQFADLAPLVRVIQDEPLSAADQVVLQVSRWDPLKDMSGVVRAFADRIATSTSAHLVLAGPDPDDIPDDPENATVMREVLAIRSQLPEEIRRRTHLVILSLRDLPRNAVVVNALQRRATVISQKSLQEGFGLAVTEAMFKRKPVVASAVGGIREQVEHRRHGLLVNDPYDLDTYAQNVTDLMGDSEFRETLVEEAYQHCVDRFVSTREMVDYASWYMRAGAGSDV